MIEYITPNSICITPGSVILIPRRDTGSASTTASASASPDSHSAPWFVKEVDKNLGYSIRVCRKPSEVSGFTSADGRYVVQQHVRDPLLTDDGRKAHVKFYVLLVCEADGVSWTLHTYKSAYLSIAPTKWDLEDISTETQVGLSCT